MIAQVRLKVAIEFHEADSRDLHKQIDALSTSTTGNTPWETSSETSSVTSGFSSREHHMDIEVRVTPSPLSFVPFPLL
jgi:hypothetical protein